MIRIQDRIGNLLAQRILEEKAGFCAGPWQAGLKLMDRRGPQVLGRTAWAMLRGAHDPASLS